MSAKRTPLNGPEILAAALGIVDAEGADALSMRRLARELGVEAMSLYHHFSGKDAILAGVIGLALAAEAPGPQAAGSSWREAVAAAVLGFRRVLVRHPNVLPVIVAHPPTSPEDSVYVTGPLRYLSAQGFSDADAGDLFQAVFALSFGHAMLSTGYRSIELEGAPPVAFTEDAFARTLNVLLRGYEPSIAPAAE